MRSETSPGGAKSSRDSEALGWGGMPAIPSFVGQRVRGSERARAVNMVFLPEVPTGRKGCGTALQVRVALSFPFFGEMDEPFGESGRW